MLINEQPQNVTLTMNQYQQTFLSLILLNSMYIVCSFEVASVCYQDVLSVEL